MSIIIIISSSSSSIIIILPEQAPVSETPCNLLDIQGLGTTAEMQCSEEEVLG